jgi:hypothetical protein
MTWVLVSISARTNSNLSLTCVRIRAGGRTFAQGLLPAADNQWKVTARSTAMKLKFLFWIAVLLAVAGWQAREGNLFYFFSVQLLSVWLGLALHRREKRGRTVRTLRVAAKGPPGSSRTAKAA